MGKKTGRKGREGNGSLVQEVGWGVACVAGRNEGGKEGSTSTARGTRKEGSTVGKVRTTHTGCSTRAAWAAHLTLSYPTTCTESRAIKTSPVSDIFSFFYRSSRYAYVHRTKGVGKGEGGV